MKPNPDDIKDDTARTFYKAALHDYKDEIALGTAILKVLDERYEFVKEDYD